MTNPDNIVRVRARNGGRASVYEANGWCQAYNTGILEGTGVTQNTSADMHVLVGGSSSKPDVIIAQNPAGYKIALDIVGQQAITITKPSSNSRISAIVAYTDDLALDSTQDTITGSPASCGLIVVNGTTSSSPSAPTDTQIRSAITSDGATGSQASYAVIATVLVASNTTTITNSLITRNQAAMGSSKIDFATLPANESTNSNFAIGSSYTSLSEYLVTVPGKYLVLANLNTNYLSSAFPLYLQLQKNTSEVAVRFTTVPASSYSVISIQALIDVSANDTIKVRAKANLSIAANVNNMISLIVQKVG